MLVFNHFIKISLIRAIIARYRTHQDAEILAMLIGKKLILFALEGRFFRRAYDETLAEIAALNERQPQRRGEEDHSGRNKNLLRT